MEIGSRGQVFIRPPISRKDTTSGTARVWGRTINGHQYSFTATLMPTGERRYRVARRERDGWVTVHSLTLNKGDQAWATR